MNDAVTQAYVNVIGGSLSAIAESLTILCVTICCSSCSPCRLWRSSSTSVWPRGRSSGPSNHGPYAAGKQLLESSVNIYVAGTQALWGIKDIKLRGSERYFLTRYHDNRIVAANAMRLRIFLSELPKYVMEILFIFGIALMTVVVYATRRRPRL